MTRLAVNGATHESQASGSPLARVPSADDLPTEATAELVGPDELARAIGVSRATIDRARRDGRLPATHDGRGWKFKRTEVVEIGELRRSVPSSARQEAEGERDARVFASFEAGKGVSAIVVDERVPARVVLALRETWLEAHRADARGLVLTCRACSRPSDPRHAFCAEHAAHVSVLTEEQRRTLAGQDIPVSIHCTACGQVADAGVCATCADAITVAVEDGVIVVRLAARIVRELPLSLLTSSIEAASAPAAAPAPAATEAVSSDATRTLLDAVHARLRSARTPLTSEDADK